MESLTHYQKRILDKIYGPLEKTSPLSELKRLLKVYFEIINNEKDRYLVSEFKNVVNSKLHLDLTKDKRFQDFKSFKNTFLNDIKEYVSDKCDEHDWKGVDGVASITKTYTQELISQQESIVDGSVKVYISIKNKEPFDLIQLTTPNFIEDYRADALLKIELLKDELEKLSGFEKKFNDDHNDQKKNPYPNLFTTYKVYESFIQYTSKHIINLYVDYSYLKKRLDKEKLIHYHTDTEFMRIMNEDLNLISNEDFNEYIIENKLRSLGKSKSKIRQINFNNIFEI